MQQIPNSKRLFSNGMNIAQSCRTIQLDNAAVTTQNIIIYIIVLKNSLFVFCKHSFLHSVYKEKDLLGNCSQSNG